jgi:hypothetical protein
LHRADAPRHIGQQRYEASVSKQLSVWLCRFRYSILFDETSRRQQTTGEQAVLLANISPWSSRALSDRRQLMLRWRDLVARSRRVWNVRKSHRCAYFMSVCGHENGISAEHQASLWLEKRKGQYVPYHRIESCDYCVDLVSFFHNVTSIKQGPFP